MAIGIQIIVNVLSILLSAYLAYYFTKQRYTFEKLYDRKLTSLEELYGKIISLEKDLKKYIHTIGANLNKESLAERREGIKPVQDKFFELQKFFWDKEIILDESSVVVIQSFIDTSIEILSNLKVSIVSQGNEDYKTSHDLWDKAFQTMTKKFEEAKIQLKKDFRKKIKN